jgi:hypothetical protein
VVCQLVPQELLGWTVEAHPSLANPAGSVVDAYESGAFTGINWQFELAV